MHRKLVIALFSASSALAFGCAGDDLPSDATLPDSAPDAVRPVVPDAEVDADIPLPELACQRGWVTHRLGSPEISTEQARVRVASPSLSRVELQNGGLVSGQANQRLSSTGSWWVAHLVPGQRAIIEHDWARSGVHVTERLGNGFVVFFHSRGPGWAGLERVGVSSARRVTTGEKLHAWFGRGRGHGPTEVEVTRWRDGRVVQERRRVADLSGVTRLAVAPTVLSVRPIAPAISQVARSREVLDVDRVQGFRLFEGAPEYGGIIGRGVRVAVVDSGIDLDHPDFAMYDVSGERVGTRVSGDGPVDGNSHGTHVAGILAGSGHLSGGYRIAGEEGGEFQWRGIAPGVERIVSVGFRGGASREVWLRAFVDGDVHLSNHSYTQSQGFYLWRVANFDEAIRNGPREDDIVRPPRIVVFSAGNYGRHAPPIEGIDFRGFHSVMATGKNPICVGATYVNDGHIAVHSSLGPTLDGRIKPDVVGPGFADLRPVDGLQLEVRSVRVHATEESGLEDLVLDLSEGWPVEEWSLHGELGERAIFVDGVLRARLQGGRGAEIRYRPRTGFRADAYDRVSFDARLILDTGEGEHSWPGHWRVVWNNRDEDRPRGGRDFPFDAERRDAEWHTWTATVAGRDRYNGNIHFLALRPVEYPYRAIISAKPDGRYRQAGGTSMSAPAVAGVTALMAERFRDSLGYDLEESPPQPSTFKAVLIHTAHDMVREEPIFRGDPNPETGETLIYGPGPDFVTGWGSVDGGRALDLLEFQAGGANAFAEHEIDEGERHTWRLPIDSSLGPGPLRVTVVWDDAPGPVMTSDFESKLVNDLDIILISPAGQAYSPWVLDPLPIDPETYFGGLDPISTDDIRPARQCTPVNWWRGPDTAFCEDHLNNVEQVLVNRPESGWWTLHIRGFVVPEGPQRYSLVVTQDCD